MRDIFCPRLADAISTARKRGGLSRLSMFDLSDALEVFSSLVRSTRRREDCLAVAFENAQPVADIVGMIGAWFCGDAKITTDGRDINSA